MISFLTSRLLDAAGLLGSTKAGEGKPLVEKELGKPAGNAAHDHDGPFINQRVDDMLMGCLVVVLMAGALVFEGLRWSCWFWTAGYLCRRKPTGEAKIDTTSKNRRLLLFDGICVVCDFFVRNIRARLWDPSSVQFVPIQDAPGYGVADILAQHGYSQKDVQKRMCVIAGDRIYFGADAVMQVSLWCEMPYFLVWCAGKCVPFRDVIYMTFSRNRHRWFGTLERVF